MITINATHWIGSARTITQKVDRERSAASGNEAEL